MPRILPLAVFTFIGLLIAMDSNAQVVKQDVEGIRNFAKVESMVACAGSISPAAIAEIRRMGYQSIINLRLANEPGAEIERHRAAAKTAGIAYYHIPFSATEPDPAAVDEFLKLIQTPGVQPAFIH